MIQFKIRAGFLISLLEEKSGTFYRLNWNFINEIQIGKWPRNQNDKSVSGRLLLTIRYKKKRNKINSKIKKKNENNTYIHINKRKKKEFKVKYIHWYKYKSGVGELQVLNSSNSSIPRCWWPLECGTGGQHNSTQWLLQVPVAAFGYFRPGMFIWKCQNTTIFPTTIAPLIHSFFFIHSIPIKLQIWSVWKWFHATSID